MRISTLSRGGAVLLASASASAAAAAAAASASASAAGDTAQHPLLGGGRAQRPNFVFIMTDDQDLHLQSLAYQASVQKHFAREGTFFGKHFCTVALCCPSRVSLLTGKAAHNTNVTDVAAPYGMLVFSGGK